MWKLFWILSLIGFAKATENPIVHIPDGDIQGKISTTYGGNNYMQFIGIPYAKAPIADLRFEDPQPVEPWLGTYMANFSTACLQINHFYDGGFIDGQEDCLYLQIFVPGTKINSEANLDVIIHFHSGAFNFASGQAYAGPKYLLDRNVILVTMNYRLGLFGFLSTADENLPGNLGMKDQVLALKWVNNNIKHFGGNANSITITGLSAGAASVHYHYMSPMSKGLYQRGISASGTPLDPWTLQKKPLERARKVASALGCNFDCTKKLVKCLKSRSDKQLVETTRLLRVWLYNPSSPLMPVVDSWSKTPFLPEHPYKTLMEGKVNPVPWITGLTTTEGLYNSADYMVEERFLPELEANWNKYLPSVLHFHDTVPIELQDKVSQAIKKQYLGDKPLSKETFKDFVKLMSDRSFHVGQEEAARLQSKVAPVYFYQFDYSGSTVNTFAEYHTGKNNKYGVCHGDDIMFIFNNPAKKLHKHSEKDEKVTKLLLDIWTSFAKTGIPSIENWNPLPNKEVKEINYLYIGGPDKVEMRKTVEFADKSFWDDLPLEENRRLFNKT